MMYRLTLCVALVGCKPVLSSGIQYQGSELMGVDDAGIQPLAGISKTADVGQYARQNQKVPGFYSAGAGLTQSGGGEQLREGARICVSSDYGRGGGQASSSNETAVKCGKLERCDQREGWLRDLPAKQGDLCMRADCLSKSTAGLDMPGELNEGVCGTNGRSTAFNVSEYVREMGAFSMDIKPQGGLGLTEGFDNRGYAETVLAGDQAYNETKGGQGNVRFTLGGEDLGSYDAIATIYKTNGLALNQGGSDANTKVYNAMKAVGLHFDEGGFSTNIPGGGSGQQTIPQGQPTFPQGQIPGDGQIIQGGSNGAPPFDQGSGIGTGSGGDNYPGATLTGSGPTPQQLGLVKTRQGNTFQLQGESFGLGAAGTVKVLISN